MGEQQAVLDYFLERLAGFDDVALAAVYGSFGTPAATPGSDVDMFFVPADDAARAAAYQVVVDDIGHDLWPLDWSRLERIAALADTLTPLLLDSRVLIGAEGDVARFDALRGQCRANLRNHGRRARAAARLLDSAAAALGRLDGEERIAVADAAGSILAAAAFLEGCYLPSGPGRVLDAGADWLDEELRRHLIAALTGAASATRLHAARCALAFADARRRSLQDGDAPPLDARDRADALIGSYEELHSLLTKVPRAIAAGQWTTARLAASDACREAGAMLHLLDTGRWPKTAAGGLNVYRAWELPDLLGATTGAALALAAGEADRRLVEHLARAGVRPRVVATVEELKLSIE